MAVYLDDDEMIEEQDGPLFSDSAKDFGKGLLVAVATAAALFTAEFVGSMFQDKGEEKAN